MHQSSRGNFWAQEHKHAGPSIRRQRVNAFNPIKLELCRESVPRFPEQGQQDKLSSSAVPLIPPPQAGGALPSHGYVHF